MLEDFRSRMGDLRQEMDRLANQAEELERVVREQQVRLEELDLQIRQRDEQLAEQQSRLEELQAALEKSEQALPELRAELAEREAALSRQGAELEELRAQLAQREANETALREELARASLAAAAPVPAEAVASGLLERFAALEGLAQSQRETLTRILFLLQEQLAQPRERPAPRATAPAVPPSIPPARVVVPAEEAPARVEVAAPAVKVAVPMAEVAEAENPFQASLQEALESFPAATLASLAGRDGLTVETVARGERPAAEPLEVELADLTSEAHRVAAAVGTGPLLTLAFQSGDLSYLVSPVGVDYFAFLLMPAGSMEEFRHAQAVLLQTASRLSELF